MARKIIVVTAAYGNDHVKSLGGQAAVLPFIANAGADGVAIPRELCRAEELNPLPTLAAPIERPRRLAGDGSRQGDIVAPGSAVPHVAI